MSSLNFKHALVALDQSDATDIVVDCLPQFRQFGTSRLTLFTSVSVSYSSSMSEATKQEYQIRMERYSKQLDSTGFDIQTEVRFKTNAYAPTEILSAADEYGADYIILANRGYSKYRELLLGSTATELLQRCSLPVFLINLSLSEEARMEDRSYHCIKACQESLEHILYPTDFSYTAERAFEVLCDLVSDVTREITLLHVQRKGRSDRDNQGRMKEAHEKDWKRLELMKDRLQESTTAAIYPRIRVGSPIRHILDTAENVDASMILMGSQGRGYISDLFLGGVSLQVIRKANIPVMTIPASRDQQEN